ncbi:MAG TPA: hypothetical protein VGB50_10325 [Flavobacterium sp.]|jgi:hypothetical protein
MKRILICAAFILAGAVTSCSSDDTDQAENGNIPAVVATDIGGQGGGIPIPPPPPPKP